MSVLRPWVPGRVLPRKRQMLQDADSGGNFCGIAVIEWGSVRRFRRERDCQSLTRFHACTVHACLRVVNNVSEFVSSSRQAPLGQGISSLVRRRPDDFAGEHSSGYNCGGNQKYSTGVES